MNNGTANDNGYQMPQQIKDIGSKILATLMKNDETVNIGRQPIYGGFQTAHPNKHKSPQNCVLNAAYAEAVRRADNDNDPRRGGWSIRRSRLNQELQLIIIR